MEIDCEFVAPESWVGPEMAERVKWLRENEPLYWSEKTGIWIITRYEDVVEISKNQELFTSGLGVRPASETRIGLIDEAEPHHGELRKLINRGFTPRMVSRLEPSFLGITTEAIDRVAARGECDFVDDIAVPLP
ncbi:MAG: cytochrome P450, partial [Myxococcota bacterium]